MFVDSDEGAEECVKKDMGGRGDLGEDGEEGCWLAVPRAADDDSPSTLDGAAVVADVGRRPLPDFEYKPVNESIVHQYR